MFRLIIRSNEKKSMIRHIKTISIRTCRMILKKRRWWFKQINANDKHFVNQNWFMIKMTNINILTTRFRTSRLCWTRRTTKKNQTTKMFVNSMIVTHVHWIYNMFIDHDRLNKYCYRLMIFCYADKRNKSFQKKSSNDAKNLHTNVKKASIDDNMNKFNEHSTNSFNEMNLNKCCFVD
jgi:hypothetical protein